VEKRKTLKERVGAASLYRLASHLYSALPYYLSRNGYAFPPWHYFLEPTRRCNQRCSMCQYIHWLETTSLAEQRAGELSTEEWQRVIDQTGRFSLVTFTGGEPWVRKDFAELLKYASARRRTHFISNGTAINEERARLCVGLAPLRPGGKGLNAVGISIEGPAEIHDAVVRLDGAFERATRAIRMLTCLREEEGKRGPFVHVTTVVQEANLDTLDQMPAIVAETGADILNLVLEVRLHDLPGLGYVDPETFKREDVHLPVIDRVRLTQALDATIDAAARRGVELRLPRMSREHILEYYAGGLDLCAFVCRSPWTTLFVNYQGDVFPCLIQKIGHIHEKRLKDLWNGPEMRAFRKHIRRAPYPVCQGCCELEFRGKRRSNCCCSCGSHGDTPDG
jgi:MoaA/NifB/PqqE/SkfB family radical SAM enzyme